MKSPHKLLSYTQTISKSEAITPEQQSLSILWFQKRAAPLALRNRIDLDSTIISDVRRRQRVAWLSSIEETELLWIAFASLQSKQAQNVGDRNLSLEN